MSSISQPDHDVEEGNEPVMVDGRPEPPRSALNYPSQPPQGDSSGPLFSIYSKIAEKEDDKMTDRWQKNADGILIFTGLFSIAVTALLAVSVQDIRPNPQDTSAFYLANIYQILADPNATVPRTPIPFPVAMRTQFSPPRYAVWVNSLWFLSLVMSLTCALLATSLHQWARRYVRLTQSTQCSPEKRARMRAFFAGGVDKTHVPWAVEALPALLHLSLFLFFSGLVVFLLNINHSVFSPVVLWIGLFSMVYGWITFMPMFRPDSPYYTPLSTPAAFILVFILTMLIAVVKFAIVSFIWIPMALSATLYYCFSSVWIIIRSRIRTSRRHKVVYGMNFEVPGNNVTGTRPLLLHHHKETWDQFMRFPGRMLYILDPIQLSIFHRAEGMWTIGKVAEDVTVKRSWEIDVGILEWTIGAMGEDYTLEKFFDAIPGFLNSKLVNVYGTRMTIHRTLSIKLRDALNNFLRRALSSNAVIESVKIRRLDIYLNAINEIFEHYQLLDTFQHLLRGDFGELPQSIETARTLARWRSAYNQDIARAVRFLVANVLQSIRKRDDRWVALARDQLCLPERFIRENISLGENNVLLSILIRITRQVISTDRSDLEILPLLSKFNIRKTLPKLQTEFCTLWNQIVLEARSEQQLWHPHVDVLRSIRHLYIALHQGTDAAPTSFSASTVDNAYILSLPSCYPLCNVATHHLNMTAVSHPTQLDDPRPTAPRPFRSGNQPISSGGAAPQQAELVEERASDHTSQELIQTIALGPSPRVMMEVTHISRRSPPSTSDLTANVVRPDEPRPDMSIDATREISQTRAATLLISSHHDIIPATVTPSTVPRPPFDSLEYSDDIKK